MPSKKDTVFDQMMLKNEIRKLPAGYELKEIDADIYNQYLENSATIVCSALILNCLEEELYPSWDAQNRNSVHLAEKLGYEFDHEYGHCIQSIVLGSLFWIIGLISIVR